MYAHGAGRRAEHMVVRGCRAGAASGRANVVADKLRLLRLSSSLHRLAVSLIRLLDTQALSPDSASAYSALEPLGDADVEPGRSERQVSVVTPRASMSRYAGFTRSVPASGKSARRSRQQETDRRRGPGETHVRPRVRKPGCVSNVGRAVDMFHRQDPRLEGEQRRGEPGDRGGGGRTRRPAAERESSSPCESRWLASILTSTPASAERARAHETRCRRCRPGCIPDELGGAGESAARTNAGSSRSAHPIVRSDRTPTPSVCLT